MTHSPHNLHSPLGWSASSSHVVPSSVGHAVSGGYAPPYVSGGQPFYQPYNYGYVAPQFQSVPNYNIPVHPFMGKVGGGYYLTSQGPDIYNNQPYIKKSC